MSVLGKLDDHFSAAVDAVLVAVAGQQFNEYGHVNKDDPRIDAILASGPVRTITLAAGDLYVMRTDTTLHRVMPISRGRRTIVNMAYASTADLTTQISHETMDGLWSDPQDTPGHWDRSPW